MAFKKWNALQKQLTNTFMREVHRPDIETVKFFAHGGKGAGKSVIMLWLINFICEHTPGITFLIVRKTFSGLKTDTINILKREPGILKGVKGKWRDGEQEFVYDNGSIIYFKHLENNEELTIGPTFGGIYVEQIELCDEEDFILLKQRLRQFSRNHEYHEVYKDAIKNKVLLPAKNYLMLSANPRGGWVMNKLVKDNNNEFTQISMPSYANEDNLPKEFFDKYASDSFKRRNYEGLWEGLKGLIYPEFNQNNILESSFNDKIDISKLNNYIIIDPGYVTSKFAIMFGCVLQNDVLYKGKTYSKGSLYVYDELCFNGKDVEDADKKFIPEIAVSIKNRIKKHGLTTYTGIIDPACKIRKSNGPTEYQQLVECGISCIEAKKTGELASINKINSMFRARKIFVSLNCAVFLQEIEVYSYKVNALGEIDEKEQPEDKSNDVMDCLRYFVNHLPFSLSDKPFSVSGYAIDSKPDEILDKWTQNLFKENIVVKKSPLYHKRIKGLDYGLI